jgi:hypothetical protein
VRLPLKAIWDWIEPLGSRSDPCSASLS